MALRSMKTGPGAVVPGPGKNRNHMHGSPRPLLRLTLLQFLQQLLRGLYRRLTIKGSWLLLVCLSPAYLASAYCAWEFNEYVKHESARALMGQGVAPVLLSGDHGAIAEWRRQAALDKTRRYRPDLLG